MTHRAITLLLYFCVFGSFLIIPLFTFDLSPAYAAVVINEIYPKPAQPDETLEWIELYNNGPETVSLDRWTLENSMGEKKTFMFNASATIESNGFLTVSRSQSGLVLSDEGDTVRLADANNNIVDNQSYASTLGFNTSVGRSTDGGGTWTICDTPATPNEPNKCTAPTPTPSPIPTNTPLPTPTFTPYPTPTKQSPLGNLVTPTTNIISPLAQPEVLGEFNVPPAAVDFMQTTTYKNIWMALVVLSLIGLLVMLIGLYKSYRGRHRA